METILHGMNEVHSTCSTCESIDSMKKLFTNSFAIKNANNTNSTNNQEVGELTQQYIEENRTLLEKEREKAKKETYDPS